MATSTTIIPNKLTMYQRVEGGVWHYRIKLKTGDWYRLSSRVTDFEAAKDIAKSKLSQNRAKEGFNSVKTMIRKLNKSYLLEAMEDIEDVD